MKTKWSFRGPFDWGGGINIKVAIFGHHRAHSTKLEETQRELATYMLSWEAVSTVVVYYAKAASWKTTQLR